MDVKADGHLVTYFLTTQTQWSIQAKFVLYTV